MGCSQLPKPDPGLINCSSCGSLNMQGCEKCNRCRDCRCGCRKCPNCSYIHGRGEVKHSPRYFCSNCGACKRPPQNPLFPDLSCSCRKMPAALPPSRPKARLIKLAHNPLRRLLGLEVEMSKVPMEEWLPGVPEFLKYKFCHDGSLSNNGRELVTSPLAGDQFSQGVGKLAEVLEAEGFGVDEKCGYHVHVDGREFGAYELRRLLLMYLKYEPLFFKLVSPVRLGNRFCKVYDSSRRRDILHLPLFNHPSELRREIIKSIYREEVEEIKVQLRKDRPELTTVHLNGMQDLRQQKYIEVRYFGLNVHTWFYRGTFEFRHHHGTISKVRLVNWALLCGWFVELASLLNDEEVGELQSVEDLIGGVWKRKGRAIQLPGNLQGWVKRNLSGPKWDLSSPVPPLGNVWEREDDDEDDGGVEIEVEEEF